MTIPVVAAGTLVGTFALGAAPTALASVPATIPTASVGLPSAAPIDSLPTTTLPGASSAAPAGPGQVAALGDATGEGQPSDLAGATASALDVVGIARTPTGLGYWLVTATGGVYAYGDAAFYGSMGNVSLNQPIVGIAATPDGLGYWLVGADGGVFSFGDAGFYGGLGGVQLNAPIVGISASPSGHGYLMVAADGGVFAFGDAQFVGGLGGTQLNAPIVGIATTGTGNGYWLAAADGGVFSFGDAAFHGSLLSEGQTTTVSAIAPSPSGDGYWLASPTGGVYAFGDALYHGAITTSDASVAGLAVSPDGGGYLEATTEPAPAPATSTSMEDSTSNAPAAVPSAGSLSTPPAGFAPLGNFVVTCYDLSGTTASGAPAGPGEVAVDPSVIPLGTTLWLQGVGTVVAEDTGSAIQGDRIDLWQSSYSACVDFGVQTLAVAEG